MTNQELFRNYTILSRLLYKNRGGILNILIITQLYPQPDDVGDNRPTKTVEYFAKEWVESENKVVAIHCPSKFPLLYYYAPKFIKKILGGAKSNIIPPIQSRKELFREEFGIKVKRIPMHKLLPGMGFSKKSIRKTATNINDFLATQGFIPDIIVGHFANPSTALVSVLSDIYSAKSSIVFHNDCNVKTIKKYNLRKWTKNIGVIGVRSIIESRKVKDLLNLDYTPFICYSGYPNDAITFNNEYYREMDFTSGIKYVFVGSFIKRKHLDVVIKAFSECEMPNDTLTIIGGGIEESNIKKLVSDIDTNNSIVLTGRISRNKVMEIMSKSHIFTLISEQETYGMVYIEAMLHGCLVIASKDGGFDGIIIDGVNGFICNPGDFEMLKTIYKRISLMSKNERESISENAIKTALSFSEKNVAKQYLENIIKINYEKTSIGD